MNNRRLDFWKDYLRFLSTITKNSIQIIQKFKLPPDNIFFMIIFINFYFI